MPTQRRLLYWRCTHCGSINQLETVPARYEPASYFCERCGEENWIQLRDLFDKSGTRWLLQRRREQE